MENMLCALLEGPNEVPKFQLTTNFCAKTHDQLTTKFFGQISVNYLTSLRTLLLGHSPNEEV